MDANHTKINGASMASSIPVNGAGPGGPVLKRRVKKTINSPFAAARQPGKLNLPSGGQAVLRTQATPAPGPGSAQTVQRSAPSSRSDPNANKHSGFTDPAILNGSKPYTDYKLVATKKDLLDGLRHHIMHLTGDKTVDVRDPSQFARPAHLHRRDPRAVPNVKDDDERIDLKDGLNEEERQALKDRNELRKAERQANLAQIAPTQPTRKGQPTKMKTKAVYGRAYTEEEKRRIQTNYEEKLPWHLEDFDNKHCYVGKNLGPSAHRHVALAYEPAIDSRTGKFRLIPVEKVYDFQPKRKAQPETTVEEAEAKMRARAHVPEWLEQMENKALEKRKKEFQDRGPRLFTGENKDNRSANRLGDDVDLDLDDEDDLFADDEEGDTFRVKDEDEALADKRIKEDQLKANFFDQKDEADYDYESEEEKQEEAARKENSRHVRKALEKHEHNYNYASDSEYSSSSEDEEDVAERDRQEAEKAKALGLPPPSTDPTKLNAPPSGATTPSGRTEKIPGLLSVSDRDAKSKRKRPGSPNISEAGSGTDTSARNKKPKTSHLSRPDTPTGHKLKVRGPNAGSDTDAAGVSDSAARRLKRKHKSSNLPSRAASPAPRDLPSRTGAESPVALTMPTVEDIRAIITSHPDGLTMAELLRKVKYPPNRQADFVSLMKTVARVETKPSGAKHLVLLPARK